MSQESVIAAVASARAGRPASLRDLRSVAAYLGSSDVWGRPSMSAVLVLRGLRSGPPAGFTPLPDGDFSCTNCALPTSGPLGGVSDLFGVWCVGCWVLGD